MELWWINFVETKFFINGQRFDQLIDDLQEKQTCAANVSQVLPGPDLIIVEARNHENWLNKLNLVWKAIYSYKHMFGGEILLKQKFYY